MPAASRPHRPPHIFQNNRLYFLTGATYQKNNFLKSSRKKKLFNQILTEYLLQFKYKCYAQVILDNHYHIILDITDASQLPDFMRRLHAKTAFLFNQSDQIKGRKIWYQYWDRCIRDENELENTIRYIYWNPCKHNYTEEPTDYEFTKIEDINLDLKEPVGIQYDFDEF